MNFLKKIWVFHMGGGFDFCVWNCSLEKKIWRKDVGKVPSKKLVFFFFFLKRIELERWCTSSWHFSGSL